jgi:hypothetical protein
MPDQNEINCDFEKRITALERLHPKPRHWYTSFGVWLAIILTLVMIYLIWLTYQWSTGHIINFGFIRFK